MATGCNRQNRAGRMPKMKRRNHSVKLKNPEASEYRVLNTLPMVISSMMMLYFRMKKTAVALITDMMASRMRPTHLRQNMIRYVIMKFTTNIITTNDIISHAKPSPLSLLLSMAN